MRGFGIGIGIGLALGGVLAIGTLPLLAADQARGVSADGGWVGLPAPSETTAVAFAVVRNPTMYDVYLTAAAADVAGTVEFRQGSDRQAQALPHVTVPAYGSITMEPAGVHMVLKDLKGALKETGTVTLLLTTSEGATLKVPAVVRKR